MKIVVTGGTGFFGRHVVWRLCNAGHEVVFTGRDGDSARDVISRSSPGSPAPRFVKVDHRLSDGAQQSKQQLIHASLGASAMIHCAALSSPWGSALQFEESNVSSTREVIDACLKNCIDALIHISTPGLYFDFTDRLGIRESDPLPKPANLYAASKRKAEELVLEAPIPRCVILRPRAIFGPWDTTLLPRLLRVCDRSGWPLVRNGNALLDMTYVDNVVDAVILSLNYRNPANRPAIFNISNGEPIQVRDLFTRISDSFDLPLKFRRIPYPIIDATAFALETLARIRRGWEPPITRYSAGLLSFSQTLDISSAKSELKYMPRTDLNEGLQKTARWFKSAEGLEVAGAQIA